MSASHDLATELFARGVTAVPADDYVRAWIGGMERGYVLITPAVADCEPVWSWQYHDETRCHPQTDIPGAATTLAAVLRADPP